MTIIMSNSRSVARSGYRKMPCRQMHKNMTAIGKECRREEKEQDKGKETKRGKSGEDGMKKEKHHRRREYNFMELFLFTSLALSQSLAPSRTAAPTITANKIWPRFDLDAVCPHNLQSDAEGPHRVCNLNTDTGQQW